MNSCTEKVTQLSRTNAEFHLVAVCPGHSLSNEDGASDDDDDEGENEEEEVERRKDVCVCTCLYDR